MSGPYADSITAIKAAWTASWPAPVNTPVVWHQNTNDQAPPAGTYDHWLHVAVEHTSEGLVAFGGGRAANERELQGSVVIRVLAQRGRGEATQLALLDDALGVFRSRRDGALSFVGVSRLDQPGASADGIWWVRSGIAVFTYRFRG